MPAFGKEYSSDNAYFIAGGRTLELIKKYEEDQKNPDALFDAIAHEYGAKKQYSGQIFMFDQETKNPAFKLDIYGSKDEWVYIVNEETPEGRALEERLKDVPFVNNSFPKRLTGKADILVNPDNIDQEIHGSTPYAPGTTRYAAGYRQYGDIYVVSIPRTIHAVFNDASKRYQDMGSNVAGGYRYEWFTPPDSQPIPYSKVVELKEKELADQTKPQQINKLVVLRRPSP